MKFLQLEGKGSKQENLEKKRKMVRKNILPYTCIIYIYMQQN